MPETTEAPAPKSVAITILQAALVQVEEVLQKAEQTLSMLQQNLAQVRDQRIGLIHQQSMLKELTTKIQNEEFK